MNTELEAYFDNYNVLFGSEGFKQLVQELSTNAQRLADIQTVKDAEDLHFRKGQVAALASVINLEALPVRHLDAPGQPVGIHVGGATIAAAREQAEADNEEVVEDV